MNIASDIPPTEKFVTATPAMQTSMAIELQQSSAVFGSGDMASTALVSTDLKLPDGAFLARVGPSGCRKSTILRLVSNLTILGPVWCW